MASLFGAFPFLIKAAAQARALGPVKPSETTAPFPIRRYVALRHVLSCG